MLISRSSTVRLPSGSGFALARRLRDRSAVSIIFLPARDAVADRVEGLELGADDCTSSKPFACWRSCWRGSGRCCVGTGRLSAVLEAGDLLIDGEDGGLGHA